MGSKSLIGGVCGGCGGLGGAGDLAGLFGPGGTGGAARFELGLGDDDMAASLSDAPDASSLDLEI